MTRGGVARSDGEEKMAVAAGDEEMEGEENDDKAGDEEGAGGAGGGVVINRGLYCIGANELLVNPPGLCCVVTDGCC